MNFKDIIGPDELDWKVIPLDWKKIGKDELKMGTPMSKDGLEANDASCYGILMDDVEKGKHFQARVIVSGCVDFDKAEAYSGVKVSEEAKKAIGKVWSQAGGGTGPIDPKRLPEGYPYKEKSVIEWDGNTDGKVVLNFSGIPYYKVAEYSEVNLVNETATVSGEEIVLERQYELLPGSICYFAGMMEVPLVIQIPTDTSVSGLGDIEQGTYFLRIGKEMVDGSMIPSEMVVTKVTGGETIHPMAPEFLPLLTSPNGTKYKLTVADDGTLSAVAVS